ncbi:glycerophosphodiester phosphodiesterase [Raphidocelis subcapitata]|uniref:glycerophosphodiester phosphodiesterase n=1 Tax=Raphidocelis subcapitata TaxID=307507 RepID=A0A2V0NWG6_9CHLO|nr:glycerophosphodiester phosphodiesterase [Raphidocelis subcapitata]|eukprot:GBF91679.1 glycerophosphodiester phosphodiesterase [Raphidocelis subcapitata]
MIQPWSIDVGGHRGMGANIIRANKLVPAYRENTLGSFQAAAATGASFVEFDVQVTADGTPVLWHDDTVDFGDPSAPTRVPVAGLTLPEFQALGGGGAAPRVVRSFWEEAAPAPADAAADAAAVADAPRGGSPPRARTPPRAWRCDVDEGFPTFEQLFCALPPGVGFDIEVKMATPRELAVTPAAEVDRVVGPVLAVAERCCPPAGAAAAAGAGAAPGRGERPIVFSSFDPDVCAALRARQSRWPVLLLSAGGREPHADARRAGLGAALRVAAGGGLDGLIVDSGALRDDPGFAAAVAAAGGGAGRRALRLLTYGADNDDPAWVLEQARLGVRGVICDDVPRVLAALRAAAAAAGAVAAVAAASAARAAGHGVAPAAGAVVRAAAA